MKCHAVLLLTSYIFKPPRCLPLSQSRIPLALVLQPSTHVGVEFSFPCNISLEVSLNLWLTVLFKETSERYRDKFELKPYQLREKAMKKL